jgi:hypothetical protein
MLNGRRIIDNGGTTALDVVASAMVGWQSMN